MSLIPQHLPQVQHQERESASRGLGKVGDDDYVNPYKGGPSAIDKAVHLFFFTEIIRGGSCLAMCSGRRVQCRRHVDRS